ncbi:hypothetical protein TpMuguga_01g00077 [Theileria parva strain Muguga]|uniref:Uncharacterized protein n=1 Tax=Theileria parva TaxID=5875 RepID=Q4N9N7_THEPA|nr:uncharacterized protein TpMuguga_01g00077 [Theileria parva strain Muguga]EAN33321.1 hypothetical protein TpMuguga_01g00077 [Theileria parva strain Muguga]|eukprot:XP_765604.1 hypothetical protein [Theileria parva strain Muguga]
MPRDDFRGKNFDSPHRWRDDSYSRSNNKFKRKLNIPEGDRSRRPVPPFPMPLPDFSGLVPPKDGNMPVLLPGMQLPPPILMNMPLPPPDSDPEEIKKALKLIMSNFPGFPKDAKLPFPPVPRQAPYRKKKRRDIPVERAPPTAEDLYELEIDKKLAEAERLQESPVSMFLKVPGLLSKRHLKGSTIDQIERAADRRKLKVRYLEHFDQFKSDREKAHSDLIERVYKEYKSLGLGKIEGVLPLLDGLD